MVSVPGRIRLKETSKNPEFGSVDRIDNSPVRDKGELSKFFMADTGIFFNMPLLSLAVQFVNEI